MSYFRFSVGFVGKSGLEPLNSEEDRFTVCCNCHYATSPYLLRWHLAGSTRSVSSRWRDSNPRQADYKSATLPTELHRLFSYVKQLFLFFWGCKDTTFFSLHKLFLFFFSTFVFKYLFLNALIWWKNRCAAFFVPFGRCLTGGCFAFLTLFDR